MTELLDHAVDKVRTLPPEVQDELASVLLQLAGLEEGVVQLTPEEAASFDESFAQARRGEFATDAEMEAIRQKFAL